MWDHVRGGVGRFKFFRIELGGGRRLRQEVFYLAYHLHWSWNEIMNLELDERRAYVYMLAGRIEQENRAVEELEERLKGKQ